MHKTNFRSDTVRGTSVRNLMLSATALGLVAVMGMTTVQPARSQGTNAVDLKRLEQIIQAQQAQLDELRRQLEGLKQTAVKAGADATAARSTAMKAMGASSENKTVEDKTVTSGSDRVKLAISGQVNRMVNIADDGQSTKVFHVDNDNSSTRMRFVGTGKVTDSLTVGTNIEVQMESNSSATVSQVAESSGTVTFTDRKLEVFFDSKNFGKVSIGQGSTASDGTAEVDESGTDVIGYSSIADMAGGLLFRNSRTGALTTVTIGGVFANFDGLGRTDRIRYDSPSFAGFKASASHAPNDQWDAALRWGGEVGGMRIAAAGAYTSLNAGGADYRLDGSASILHLGTGLNLTLSAGQDDNMGARMDDQSYYAKAGWRGDLTSLGETAFSIDYSNNENIAANNDEAKSYGVFVVQNWKEFGTQFYGGVRTHELNRPGTPTDDITVFSAGTRVKF